MAGCDELGPGHVAAQLVRFLGILSGHLTVTGRFIRKGTVDRSLRAMIPRRRRRGSGPGQKSGSVRRSRLHVESLMETVTMSIGHPCHFMHGSELPSRPQEVGNVDPTSPHIR